MEGIITLKDKFDVDEFMCLIFSSLSYLAYFFPLKRFTAIFIKEYMLSVTYFKITSYF